MPNTPAANASASTLIHTRSYTVKAYHDGPNNDGPGSLLRLRGAILDEKPAGLYFEGDPEPLPIHQMVIDLILGFPSLEILDAKVIMEVTPHDTCQQITTSYDKLIGLSIARGFSRQMRELFGGPRGCTHIGALLQAMAPVAVQSMWSMHMVDPDSSPIDRSQDSLEDRREAMKYNLNSCHVWEESGTYAQLSLQGKDIGPPLWASERLVKLGKKPQDWKGW